MGYFIYGFGTNYLIFSTLQFGWGSVGPSQVNWGPTRERLCDEWVTTV